MKLPRFIAHADWGAHARKRWFAPATIGPNGSYVADAPRLVGGSGSFLARMGDPGSGVGPRLCGFDFPIGVPRAYAQRAGITDFRSALLRFGEPPWDRFYDVAPDAGSISLYRPFYPAGNGIKGQHKRAFQRRALSLDANQMLRRCDAPFGGTHGAHPLVRHEGRARALGEAHSRRSSRAGAGAVGAGAHDRIDLTPALRAEIVHGFGGKSDGEDRFDAVVGLFGMVRAVQGTLSSTIPNDREVASVEGWILGRPQARMAAFARLEELARREGNDYRQRTRLPASNSAARQSRR